MERVNLLPPLTEVTAPYLQTVIMEITVYDEDDNIVDLTNYTVTASLYPESRETKILDLTVVKSDPTSGIFTATLDTATQQAELTPGTYMVDCWVEDESGNRWLVRRIKLRLVRG